MRINAGDYVRLKAPTYTGLKGKGVVRRVEGDELTLELFCAPGIPVSCLTEEVSLLRKLSKEDFLHALSLG